ncbi:MAG: DeoR family transcriptional regulator [Candidatus Methylomirabilia bacterium]
MRRVDLIARFGISERTAQRDLVALVRAGFVRRSGTGRGSRYTLPSRATDSALASFGPAAQVNPTE